MAESGPAPLEQRPFAAGVFLLDKPPGMTSFGVVRHVRRLLGIKKVGHAGTLDPFASGLLIICAGRPATRLIQRFMGGRKTYRATIQLGTATTTMDPEGEVAARSAVPDLETTEIGRHLHALVGPGLQAPPPFSAVKYKGKPLYHYARKGVIIDKEPRPITIYSLELCGYDPAAGTLEIEIVCSPGTYIRVLGEEIGRSLDTCAHVCRLRRTASGRFGVGSALPAQELLAENGRERLLAVGMEIGQAMEQLAEADPFCLASASALD